MRLQYQAEFINLPKITKIVKAHHKVNLFFSNLSFGLHAQGLCR